MTATDNVRELTRREKEIREAAKLFEAEHRAWQNDNARPDWPDANWWRAYEQFDNIVAAGSIPERLVSEGVWRRISEMRLQTEAYDLQESIDPNPKAEFWRTIDVLFKSFEAFAIPPIRHRESIHDLAKADVPYEQIGRMMGLVDNDGKGRVDLVSKELREPGSVIGPDWVHPDDLRAEENRRRIMGEAEEIEKLSSEPEESPATETLEQIWHIGREEGGTPVTIDQAARMLRKSIADIKPEWDELDRKEAQRTARRTATAPAAPVDPAPVPPQPEAEKPEKSDDPAPPLAVEPEEFAVYDDPQLKELAKSLGIGVRGRQSRSAIISKILQARESIT